jgi:hypothetical protein
MRIPLNLLGDHYCDIQFVEAKLPLITDWITDAGSYFASGMSLAEKLFTTRRRACALNSVAVIVKVLRDRSSSSSLQLTRLTMTKSLPTLYIVSRLVVSRLLIWYGIVGCCA